jgi:hypothetical protein
MAHNTCMNNEYINLAIITLVFGSIMLVALTPSWFFRAIGTIILWVVALTAVIGPLWYILGYAEF